MNSISPAISHEQCSGALNSIQKVVLNKILALVSTVGNILTLSAVLSSKERLDCSHFQIMSRGFLNILQSDILPSG